MELQEHEQALRLSYFTFGYTLFEAVSAIILGAIARSPALMAFGLDSAAESFSSGVMIWRFRQHHDDPHEEEKIEKRAITLVAYSFFILSAYVIFDSSKALYFHQVANPSPLGIVLTVLALCVMLVLFLKKYRLAKSMSSKSLLADSKQTLACVLLSITTLVGLGLNYFGIWWADPLAALVIGVLLAREGYHTYQEQKLCAC